MTYTEYYADYKWIKVKKHVIEDSESWEERYNNLSKHHVEETTFLINEVRKLASSLDQKHNLLGPMGMGNITHLPPKKKWRWYVEISNDNGIILPYTFCKVGSRPSPAFISYPEPTIIEDTWTIFTDKQLSVEQLQRVRVALKLCSGDEIIESYKIDPIDVFTVLWNTPDYSDDGSHYDVTVKYSTAHCEFKKHPTCI